MRNDQLLFPPPRGGSGRVPPATSQNLNSGSNSQFGKDVGFDGADAVLVTPVECPLLDAFRLRQLGLDQDSHVLAQGRLGDSQLLGEQQRADAVLSQITIDLRREMRAR